MTTVADVKRVTRLVREREPRLVLHKRLLILPPVGHYLRALMLDQRRDPKAFRVCYFVQPLYAPANDVGLGYGRDLHDGFGDWSIDDPLLEERLAKVLLGERMSRIGGVETPLDFLEFAKTVQDDRAGRHSIFLTLALLHRFDEARDFGESMMKTFGPRSRSELRLRRFFRLFEGDPERVDRILKAWGELTVQRIGIGQHWRSPWR